MTIGGGNDALGMWTGPFDRLRVNGGVRQLRFLGSARNDELGALRQAQGERMVAGDSNWLPDKHLCRVSCQTRFRGKLF